MRGSLGDFEPDVALCSFFKDPPALYGTLRGLHSHRILFLHLVVSIRIRYQEDLWLAGRIVIDRASLVALHKPSGPQEAIKTILVLICYSYMKTYQNIDDDSNWASYSISRIWRTLYNTSGVEVCIKSVFEFSFDKVA